MISISRLLLVCLSATQLSLLLLDGANAFVVPSHRASPSARIIAAASQKPDSATELAAFSRRREVFSNLRKAVFAGGIASVFSSKPVFAEETSPSTGRIVTFEIANVGGEEGKTGTVKIQMRPEWAPLGVKRFEVSVNDYLQTFYLQPGP